MLTSTNVYSGKSVSSHDAEKMYLTENRSDVSQSSRFHQSFPPMQQETAKTQKHQLSKTLIQPERPRTSLSGRFYSPREIKSSYFCRLIYRLTPRDSPREFPNPGLRAGDPRASLIRTVDPRKTGRSRETPIARVARSSR